MSRIYDALRKHESERRSGRRAEPEHPHRPPRNMEPPPPRPIPGAPASGENRPPQVALPPLDRFPRSFWKSVRRIAAGIQAGVEHNERAILFVAVEPGAGSSTLALATSIVLVEDPGVEVLLVDAHARPQEAPLLPNAEVGLIQLALGQATMWEAIAPTDRRGLGYLPRGSGSYNGPKLFERMIPLLSSLRAVYDYLIFDVAPVVTATESAQLAGICDGVVVVLRSERTSRGEAVRTREILDQHRARIIGSVLNRARSGLLSRR